jgi:glycosyltransferase involved in cell wall biosynthesis
VKVVHVHRVRGVGGSERHLLTLLPALRTRGVDARFLGLDDGEADPFYEQLDALGVPHDRLSAPRDLDPVLLVRMARLLRRQRPDIVHTHLVHADVYGGLAAIAAGATVVSTKHNDDPFRRGSFRYVERLFARRAARVICITDALACFNVREVGLPDAKLVVVHYGLDELPPAWGPPGEWDLPQDAPLLLAISRLDRQKGLDVAIDALARIRAAGLPATLLILGGGSLEAELRALAEERGVGGATVFAGRTGDVAYWLERADVFVHPARWEGFGLVLLEAMLARLPIVASRVSSIPEIVVDGETGYLVPADDVERFTSATAALLEDAERRKAFGDAALDRARSEFSVERMATGTLAVYAKAIDG